MKIYFSLLSVLILSILAEASVQASPFAAADPTKLWGKKLIHVCWHSLHENTDFKDEQKKAVQQIIEQEYTLERAGITFFGWEECSTLAPQDYDVDLFQDIDTIKNLSESNTKIAKYRETAAEGLSTLGYVHSVEKQFVYLMYRPLLRIFRDHFHGTEELQLTALHEFGHVAGLVHEHVRVEAKTDPNCIREKSLTDEVFSSSVKFYEEYDPNSVMNYCWNDTILQNGTLVNELPNLVDPTLYTEVINPKTKQKNYQIKIGLSAKDLSTLNKIYPKE